jgi:hypothetical protein
VRPANRAIYHTAGAPRAQFRGRAAARRELTIRIVLPVDVW